MTVTVPVVDGASAAHPADAGLRVVVVNGSPSQPSKTMGLVDVILDTLAAMLALETSRIDVYRLGSGFTRALERDDVTPEVEAALRLTEGDFDGTVLLNPRVHGRIQVGLTDVAGLLRARETGIPSNDWAAQ